MRTLSTLVLACHVFTLPKHDSIPRPRGQETHENTRCFGEKRSRRSNKRAEKTKQTNHSSSQERCCRPECMMPTRGRLGLQNTQRAHAKYMERIGRPPLPPSPLIRSFIRSPMVCRVYSWPHTSGSTFTSIVATAPNLLLLNFFFTASRSPASSFRRRETCGRGQ